MQQALWSLLQSVGFGDQNADTSNIQLSPINEGETIVGELDEFEKQCLVFLNQKRDEEIKICQAWNQEMDQVQLDELNRRRYLIDQTINMATHLLYISIIQRMKYDRNSEGFHIREGCKIVSVPIKEEEMEVVSLVSLLNIFSA